MAMTASPRNSVKPFITVVRPNSTAIGGEETKIDQFEKLFDKWKRRQDYRRKVERKNSKKKNKISDSKSPTTPTTNGNVEALSDEKLEPFDFQNPPKVLQIKPVTLVSKRKKRALPKLVVKETVASKARRYTYFMNRFYVTSKCFFSKF